MKVASDANLENVTELFNTVSFVSKIGRILPHADFDLLEIVKSCAVELFAENNDPKGSKEPLGLLAMQIAQEVSSVLSDQTFHQGVDLELHDIPLLSIHGRVEEVYLNLQKQAYTIDTKGKGD
jgi:hypothetical protein